MFKFKKGDLVEIINSEKGNTGCRFLVGDFKEGFLRDFSYCRHYNSYIRDHEGDCLWTAEHNLRLVKPDTPSDISFEELMLDLKQPQVEGVRCQKSC